MNHYIYGPDSNEPKKMEEPKDAPYYPAMPASSQWQYVRPEKKSRWKSYFAALMSGAMLMGGLMFAADKYDLFTKASTETTISYAENVQNESAVAVSGIKSGSELRTAALSSSGNVVRPNQIAEMVEFASPAVVKIETKVKTQSFGNSYMDDPIFRYFFGDSGSSGQQDESQGYQSGGEGSGFIFEKTGYILTNQHVIEGADQIFVTVEGYDQPLEAKLLGSERDLDLAVLKIEGKKDFATLPLGSSENIRVGDWVVAIGNPYGFDHTVTVGVLSAKGRPIDIPEQNAAPRKYKNLLQTDASINPGNSGGPLLNLNGEVVGINTAVSAQAQGIGFAIPTSTISSVLDNLKNNIKTPKPYIGVYMQKLDKTTAKQLGLPNANGAFIRAVVTGSPADKAGIEPYDVIVGINSKAVNSPTDLEEIVKSMKIGTKINVTLYRDGAKVTTAMLVDDRNNVAK